MNINQTKGFGFRAKILATVFDVRLIIDGYYWIIQEKMEMFMFALGMEQHKGEQNWGIYSVLMTGSSWNIYVSSIDRYYLARFSLTLLIK